MNREVIEEFGSVEERLQYQLAEKVIRPLSWIHTKILALIKELKFFQYTLKFGQRDDDVYICTYVKSGTTLLQMMLYQMTTDGNIDFDHIYDVSPWIRNDSFRNKPPLHFPSPRIIKSHDRYQDFEKRTKGRFIHVLRNGKDVAVSLYHQHKNYNEPNLKFEDTFRKYFVKNSPMNWFTYNQHWLKNKNGFPILYLTYEDLVTKKEEMIIRIAKFLNISLTQEIIDRTLERTSFEFMKVHEDKFGEQPTERVYNQFIRKGKIGEGQEVMNENQMKFFDEQLEKKFGQFKILKYEQQNTVTA